MNQSLVMFSSVKSDWTMLLQDSLGRPADTAMHDRNHKPSGFTSIPCPASPAGVPQVDALLPAMRMRAFSRPSRSLCAAQLLGVPVLCMPAIAFACGHAEAQLKGASACVLTEQVS